MTKRMVNGLLERARMLQEGETSSQILASNTTLGIEDSGGIVLLLEGIYTDIFLTIGCLLEIGFSDTHC